MNMPGFTAELSMYNVDSSYRETPRSVYTDGRIHPAQGIDITDPPPHFFPQCHFELRCYYQIIDPVTPIIVRRCDFIRVCQ